MLLNLKLILFIDALLLGAMVLFYLCLSGPWKRMLIPIYVVPVLLVPVVGLIAHDKNVFYYYLFFVPFLSMGDPKKLACIYLLMLPQFPDLLQQYAISTIYLGDFSAIHFLNLGAFVAFLFCRGPGLRPIGSLDLAVWLFFLVCLGVATRGLSLTSVFRQTAQTFLNVIPPYYIVSRSLRTQEAATEATLAFVLGGICNAVVAMFEARRSWPLYQQIYYQMGIPPDLSATLNIRAGFLRAQGAVANPTSLSLLFAFALIGTFAMRGRFTRPGQWIVIGALVLGMLASQSRGGWIAAGGGLMLYLLYTHRTTRVLALGVAAFAAWTVITIGLSDSGTVGQLVGRSGDAQQTAVYRSNLFQRGLQEVWRHPITGQTIDGLQISMNDMRQGQHIIDFVNSHLYVALTLGLFGLLAWLAAWFVPMRVGWRARPGKQARAAGPPIEFPFAMVGASFIGLTFTSPGDRTLPWTMIGFGLVAAFVAINRLKTVPAAERTPAPLVELPQLARITQAA